MSISDPAGLRARFLAAIAQAEPDVATPDQLCHACLTVLPVQRVSITISSTEGAHEFLSASDDVAERMEWIQITLGEGPGMDVDADGPIVVQDAAGAATPWPLFAKEAAAAGVSVICALPLQLGTIRVGVLSLYLPPMAPFSERDFDNAIVIADLITSVLISGSTTGVLNALDRWWDQPETAREINQATGMVMVQLGVSAHEAYLRLQAYSFANGRLLGDVARDVVHNGLLIDIDHKEHG